VINAADPQAERAFWLLVDILDKNESEENWAMLSCAFEKFGADDSERISKNLEEYGIHIRERSIERMPEKARGNRVPLAELNRILGRLDNVSDLLTPKRTEPGAADACVVQNMMLAKAFSDNTNYAKLGIQFLVARDLYLEEQVKSYSDNFGIPAGLNILNASEEFVLSVLEDVSPLEKQRMVLMREVYSEGLSKRMKGLSENPSLEEVLSCIESAARDAAETYNGCERPSGKGFHQRVWDFYQRNEGHIFGA
jgi:hypothetical protein